MLRLARVSQFCAPLPPVLLMLDTCRLLALDTKELKTNI